MSPRARKGNLPVERLRFVGRRDELAALSERRHPNIVCVTLIGVGGTGKTRLAIEVGHRARAYVPRRMLDGPAAPVMVHEAVPFAVCAGSSGIPAPADR